MWCPSGSGFFNFSDTAIYLSAFLLGPIPGLLAGGIGAALADISLGYGAFAPLTFFAHGIQGLVAGYLARPGTNASRIQGVVGGTIVMVGLYFLGEYFGGGFGWGGPRPSRDRIAL